MLLSNVYALNHGNYKHCTHAVRTQIRIIIVLTLDLCTDSLKQISGNYKPNQLKMRTDYMAELN